jgi:hypothetical protein
VRDYYGLVLDVERFYKLVQTLKDLRSGKMTGKQVSEGHYKFLKEFGLLNWQANSK